MSQSQIHKYRMIPIIRIKHSEESNQSTGGRKVVTRASGEGADGEIVFAAYRVPLLQVEESSGNRGWAWLRHRVDRRHAMSGTHKNGEDGKLDVMCILPQGKINVYIHA